MSLPLIFALAFPIDAPAGEPVFAVDIPEEAYATLATPGRHDLAVVDADGKPQLISWQRAPETAPAPAALIVLPPPVPLPPTAQGVDPGSRVALQVERDAGGSLRRVEVEAGTSVPPATRSAQSAGLLVDAAKAAESGYDGLRITPAEAGDLRTRIDVRGSDDLATWVMLAADAPLLRVTEGGQTFSRLDLRFTTAHHRYLWIAPADAAALPALTSVDALRTPAAAITPLRVLRLQPRPIDASSTRFAYPAPGPLPLAAVGVVDDGGNAVLAFTLRHDDPSAPAIARGSAWQFDVDGRALRSPPIPAAGLGLGPLHLETATPAQAPQLELHFAADRLVVVAAGRPPFRLLAGSARYRADPIPLADALAGLQSARGPDWTAPVARVGAAVELAGPAALRAAPRVDAGTLVLWGVLGLGAVLVGATAWRLLRS
jgi:hypothetical protein